MRTRIRGCEGIERRKPTDRIKHDARTPDWLRSEGGNERSLECASRLGIDTGLALDPLAQSHQAGAYISDQQMIRAMHLVQRQNG